MFAYRVLFRSAFRAASTAIIAAGLTALPAASHANSKYAAMVYDVKTGKTLFLRHADSYRYPASLTKIMTLYIVFEEIELGRLKKSSRLKVSKRASLRPPSKIGFKPGHTISVDNAIRSLVTKSANDVASTIAENISGTEYRFGLRMTQTARKLGMTRTTFRNASGLPDSKQRTTARDMIRLAQAIQQRFPQHYHYFSMRSFKFKGRSYRNHNKLLGRVRGVDGIKTGYIRASGFNLVTSVKDRGRHVVAVVMGGRTGTRRDAHMTKLIGTYLPRASRKQTARNKYARFRRPGNNLTTVSKTARILPKTKPGHLAKDDNAPQTTATTQSMNVVMQTATPSQTIGTIAKTQGNSKRIIAEQTQDGRILYTVISENSADVQKLPAARKTISASAGASGLNQQLAQTTQSSSRPSWQVQIAAVPSKTSADTLLARTRSVSKIQLASARASSQRIERNGQIFYRARFVGFQSKQAANLACQNLQKKSIDCFTIYQ